MWDEEINRGYQRKERKTKTAQQALSALMALCAKAEKSSGDARRLMTQWGVAKEEQGAVLERLQKERFIDDERYAAAFVREKTRLNGWGEYKIRMQLGLKGVPKEIIENELEGLRSAEGRESMREKLDELMRKRLRTTKYTTQQQLREKLTRYGSGLGYDYGTVSAAVTNALTRLEEEREEDE
ncbi:MAG: regulatory protein RecX [Rikenellaceae bacterium]